uniref:protein draper isoform X2 n=1 Tax=Anopheles coluzzii TaxID=1518534 RepID=UPI0020FFD07A|nr:protein draper isoform X2 [Anopheles coluzzii]
MARARKKLCMQMHPTSSTAVSGLLLLAMLVAICHDVRVLAHTELIKDDHLEGPNVCKEVENITVTITTPREEAYQERYQKWCLGIPPRCSAYRIKIRTVNETRTVINQRIVKKCCVGYQLDEEQLHCIPECKAGCVYGTCINPDVCRCNKGYAGKTCNISCPPNVWGSDCKQPCKCANGAVCNAADGSCECSRGFKGRYCEETCPSDRFGQDCAEICQCKNGGKCDHVSGECFCAAGYTGPLCTEPCPAGTHGAQCQSKCRCQNGGTCDPVTGECVCPAGFTGMVCANRCQPGWYGLQCAKRCECFNGADCDRVTGQCICAPGFMGAKCLDSCPNNQYGINCTETCRCQNEGICDTADGRCTCPDGWKGADCGQRICPQGRYGANCTGVCDCKWDNTKMCHPWTGKCLCEPGWSNSACDRPCRFLRYGQDCQLMCNCKNSSPCSHIDGTCLCIAGFKGESCEEPCSNNTYGQNCSERCQCMNGAACDGESGKCACAPGWQGIKCDRPCDAQHYGRDCTEKCHCQNGGVCNPINGQCTCPAGWTGELCDKKCSPGRFGQNCEQLCDCHLENSLACNATTGRCICKADWGGVRCESRCPLGYYGESCSEICTCHNNSSCDPTTGECICSRGWTGPSCNEPCPKGFFGHGCMERCSGSAESNRTCNPITGQYSCPPGYVGPTCEHPCSSGYYGQDCQKKCPECRNGAECSHITGECQCTPGWKGPLCETVCEGMYYGTNCSQVCNCKNNAKCRKNDGTCICDAGWMGHRCDEVCPEGFYGNHCMEACECPAGNFLCHAAKGCVCSVGWTGKNCDERMTNMLTQDRVDEATRLVNEANHTSNDDVTNITENKPKQAIEHSPALYNLRIELLNDSDTHHHEREHHVLAGEHIASSRPKASAVYNVTVEFSLYGNSFLTRYNRTHSLRPGQQMTLQYRDDGFLDLTLVQMNSYVTLGEDLVASSSANVMETFINSTSYRVGLEEGLTVYVSYVDLQERNDLECDCEGNRTFLLRTGQKMVIRLIRMKEPTPKTIEETTVIHEDESVDHSTDATRAQNTAEETTDDRFRMVDEVDGHEFPITTTSWMDTVTSDEQSLITEAVPVVTESLQPTNSTSKETSPGVDYNRNVSNNSREDATTPQTDLLATNPTTVPSLMSTIPSNVQDLITIAVNHTTESIEPTNSTVKEVSKEDANSSNRNVPDNTQEDSKDGGPTTVKMNLSDHDEKKEEYLNEWLKEFYGLDDEVERRMEKDDKTITNSSSSVVAQSQIQPPERLLGSSSSTVWMVVLLLMFGAMLTAMLLYYRRRVASLKAEVNHVVNYMTQEQPSHFDNPVYARTGGGGAPNGGSIASGTLSSNGTIVPPLDARTGLLRNVLPNNLRDVMSGRRKQNQDKYSYPDNEYDVDKSLSFSHYRPESLKNFEADMTNPNFKDHVYDEIRLKDSIDTEYDHLDYSRPGSSHKAHYFRMNDGASNGNVTANGGGTLTASIASSNAYGNGSPKAINVLRDTASAGPINNLSAPPTASRVNNLLPAIPSVPAEAKCSNTDSASLGNDLSSSSNSSSPTPPSSPSQQRQRLVPGGDDLYVPMSAGVAAATSAEHGSSASSSGSEFGGLKIPDHQLNIKE